MTIEDEFLRVLIPSVNRAAKWLPSGSVHFGTDVGLRRDENEDRVAVLRWSEAGPDARSFLAVAVVDGMGGMIDGARCAALTVAAYFTGLLEHAGDSLSEHVRRSAHLANRRVFDAYLGKGGATLSSIVVGENDKAITLNVGDSRIYGLARSSGEGDLTRLSVDDNFKEAFQGEGNELIQFIGLGPGLHPHIDELSSTVDQVILTSDGAHYVDPTLFSRLVTLAPDIKAITDRSIALGRWLGGHDNITVAAVDIAKSRSSFEGSANRTISLFSAFADVSFIIVDTPNSNRRVADSLPISELAKTVTTKAKKRAATKKQSLPKNEQLAIDIEVSSRKDIDADR